MDSPEFVLGLLFFISFCINIYQKFEYGKLKYNYNRLKERFEKALMSKR